MTDSTTDFAIVGVPMPASATVGLTHSLKPISESRAGRRNVNGVYRPRPRAGFRKYEYVVEGDGVAAPAFGTLWPDVQYTVHAGAEIRQTAGVALGRTAVAGSVRYEDADERTVAADDASRVWVVYRPVLTVVLTSYEVRYDEWGAAASFTATFEEV
jgi:hypothetical protein